MSLAHEHIHIMKTQISAGPSKAERVAIKTKPSLLVAPW